MRKKNIDIDRVLSGLSLFQYMMAKLKKSWQNAYLLSLHELGIKGKIYAGYNLSYEDELILEKNIGEYKIHNHKLIQVR